MDLWDKFVELTIHHFSFLESDFKFVRKTAKHPFVFYESDKIQVGVYYDKQWSHELDLSIRKSRDDPGKTRPISIGVLIKLNDGREREPYRSPFPKSEKDLEIEVARLAEFLKKYGTSILKGEERDFERRDRNERKLQQEIRDRRTAKRVELQKGQTPKKS